MQTSSPSQSSPAARQVQGYEALLEIATQIQAEVNLDKVFALIVQKARQLLTTDVAYLGLVDENTDQLYMRATQGIRTPELANIRFPMGVGVGGTAVAQRRPIVIRDYRTFEHRTLDYIRAATLKEGVVSVVCVPLLREESMVGALYVANRRPTDFSPVDVSLLSALAAQASIAIINARLHRQQEESLARLQDLNVQLEAKHRLLEQTFSVHRQLTEAALSGADFRAVATTLSRLLNRPLVVEQTVSFPFVSAFTPSGSASDGKSAPGHDRVSAPILAGSDKLGQISVLDVTALSDVDQRALEQASTIIALGLVNLRAARDEEWRLHGEVLEALLETQGAPAEALWRRAERLGLDLTTPCRILVLQPDQNHEETELHGELMITARQAARGCGTVLGLRRGERIVLAVPVRPETRPARLAGAILEAFRRRDFPLVSVGVSGPATSDRGFAGAYHEATACLNFARSAGAHGAVVCYDDLGPLQFLLDAPDARHAMRYVQQRLGPLLDPGRSRDGVLMQTVRAYVDTDGHHPTVAKRLYIHPSTVKYRLGRIAEVLGAPLKDLHLKFELRLAFRLLDLFTAMGVSVFHPD